MTLKCAVILKLSGGQIIWSHDAECLKDKEIFFVEDPRPYHNKIKSKEINEKEWKIEKLDAT